MYIYRGIELKLARGERISRACAREARAKFTPPPSEHLAPQLGIIFAHLWAYFNFFFLFSVRMAKSSGGELPPPLSSSARLPRTWTAPWSRCWRRGGILAVGEDVVAEDVDAEA